MWDPMPSVEEEGLGPVYVEEMMARGEEDYDDGLVNWMEYRKQSPWVSAASDATDAAEELGWRNWQ